MTLLERLTHRKADDLPPATPSKNGKLEDLFSKDKRITQDFEEELGERLDGLEDSLKDQGEWSKNTTETLEAILSAVGVKLAETEQKIEKVTNDKNAEITQLKYTIQSQQAYIQQLLTKLLDAQIAKPEPAAPIINVQVPDNKPAVSPAIQAYLDKKGARELAAKS